MQEGETAEWGAEGPPLKTFSASMGFRDVRWPLWLFPDFQGSSLSELLSGKQQGICFPELLLVHSHCRLALLGSERGDSTWHGGFPVLTQGLAFCPRGWLLQRVWVVGPQTPCLSQERQRSLWIFTTQPHCFFCNCF